MDRNFTRNLSAVRLKYTCNLPAIYLPFTCNLSELGRAFIIVRFIAYSSPIATVYSIVYPTIVAHCIVHLTPPRARSRGDDNR